MSGDPKCLPWRFLKGRTRLIVKDADGGGPLFIIEGGYNAEAVTMIERALRHTHSPLGYCVACNHVFQNCETQYGMKDGRTLCGACCAQAEGRQSGVAHPE